MPHHVIISIASNHSQHEKLAAARYELCQILDNPKFTTELWTEPMGRHKESLYLNQLVAASYEGTETGLNARLKQLEIKLGRTEQERRFGIVDIDLDLLLFDNDRLHLRDWERPYIQQLIKEL
jgi:2-amino-4-hydroxy-6-hydroxymethyldihydropteridine diphosphokinase